VTAYGHLATSTGEPVSGQQVWLLERTAGQAGVSQVASGTTGADGSVQLASPALAHSARLRLVTDSKVRSAAIAVIVTPTITPTVTQGGTSDSIHLSTNADPGDTITLQIRSGGSWHEFASNQLDGSGGATFGVTAPTKHPEHFRAILPRTRGHGFATARFTVPPG
jgi:hypothetical protein